MLLLRDHVPNPFTQGSTEERPKKQPKHDASSDDNEQTEASLGNSSVGYEDLRRTTQDLISRDCLKRNLPPDSSGSRKQKHWEKRCRKHMKLLDKHLVRANAGDHAIPSKSLRTDAKSLEALLSVAHSYLQDLERIQGTSATKDGKKQSSFSTEETVQDKWLSLTRGDSVGASTGVPSRPGTGNSRSSTQPGAQTL
ncbi:hypothetical protein PG994_011552 [Apiospora phragmitis]|uniref:BHLH domain-containing protein n=1 Tax=Apiospora phragmitis TaxID=2905665 RepID=A0ABR1TTF8_9PEZI